MTSHWPRRAAALLLLSSLELVAGCSAQVTDTSSNIPSAANKRPPKVLVADFRALPGAVQLDLSPGVQLQRSSAGISPAQAEAEDIADVQNTLSDSLVEKIQAMGLPAARVPAGTMPGPGEALVTGQITSVSEGNRARRTIVGFGAGKVSVEGNAELLLGTASGPELLQSYSTNANSGRMPGMGMSAAAGGVESAATAVSGSVHGVEEAKRSPVAQEATKMAGNLAVSLGQYFAAQNWIPASAVPSTFP